MSWSGGAYTATPATGENWASLMGTPTLLFGLSLIGLLVMIAGQLAFALSVLGVVATGRASIQEVLVTRGEAS
jgi:hypothetical protein